MNYIFNYILTKMVENANKRLETTCTNLSHKFLMRSCDYQKQFSHLYAVRLAEMTKLIKIKALEKWGNEYPIKKLCELREEEESCIIIGTIFKHQVHKPSILREISEENQLAPQPPRQHYADPDDKLIMEDELQRVRLFGKVDIRKMATGVVCAVLGSIEEDGRFDVEDLLHYESGPQKPLKEVHLAQQIYLVLVSGLDQVESHHYADSLNLFQNWLCGNIGGSSSINPCQLVRLIVAGNSVRTSAEMKVASLQSRAAEPSGTLDAVRDLDMWFSSWTRSIPVDVMPGEYDPANFMLPQQPFHRCMFQEAGKYSSFRSVPNPYAFDLDDTLVIGCSGQNVKDILRTTHIDQPLEALRSMIIWSHIAPTSPDTLACYPYIESDPFIMQECPHVYFVGNCDEFQTELHEGSSNQRTRLVCVPSFSKTQSVAVVNLSTLECQQISFCIPK